MRARAERQKAAGTHARVLRLRGNMQGEGGRVRAVKTRAEKPGAVAERSANARPSEAAETHENACPGAALKGRHTSGNLADV